MRRFNVEPSLDALRQSQTQSATFEFTQEESRPPKYLAGRYTRIEGSHGELHNAALVFRDITEMRQKEKLKRDFLSYVSHKLKTPLTIIGGYVDLEGRQVRAAPPAAGDADRPDCRQGRGAFHPDREAALLRRADGHGNRAGRAVGSRWPNSLTAYASASPSGIRASQSSGRSRFRRTSRARAPEELLSLVVDNLLDNAVRYAGRADVRIEVSAAEIEDRQLRLAVSDNGPGIPTEDRDQVFSDFSPGEETFTGNIGGIGLGLPTARQLVRSWGGEINFESAPGQGATFFFTVPSEFTPARETPERRGA